MRSTSGRLDIHRGDAFPQMTPRPGAKSPGSAAPRIRGRWWSAVGVVLLCAGEVMGTTGACCLPDGTCSSMSEDLCSLLGGSFVPNLSCLAIDCDLIAHEGACCLLDSSCVRVTATTCLDIGGMYLGEFTPCHAFTACPVFVSCCLAEGTCLTLSHTACIAAGGIIAAWALDIGCDSAVCTGACCFEEPGGCLSGLSRLSCLSAGGDWQGTGSTCGAGPCRVISHEVSFSTVAIKNSPPLSVQLPPFSMAGGIRIPTRVEITVGAFPFASIWMLNNGPVPQQPMALYEASLDAIVRPTSMAPGFPMTIYISEISFNECVGGATTLGPGESCWFVGTFDLHHESLSLHAPEVIMGISQVPWTVDLTANAAYTVLNPSFALSNPVSLALGTIRLTVEYVYAFEVTDRHWRGTPGASTATPQNWMPPVTPDPTNGIVFDRPETTTVMLAPSARWFKQARAVRGAVTMSGGQLPAGLPLLLDATDRDGIVVGSAESGGDEAMLRFEHVAVHATDVVVALDEGSTGTLALQGSAASLSLAGRMRVGPRGSGAVELTGGAGISTLSVLAGDTPGSRGRVLVSGPGSQLSSALLIDVPRGEIDVRNGGRIVAGSPFFGGTFILPPSVLRGDAEITSTVVNLGRAVPDGEEGDPLVIAGRYFQRIDLPLIGTRSGALTVASPAALVPGLSALFVTQGATLGGGLIVDHERIGAPSPGALVSALRASEITGAFDVLVLGNAPPSYALRLLDPSTFGPPSEVVVEVIDLGEETDFPSPDSIVTDGPPVSLAVADLNDDGLDDLVLAVAFTGALEVLLSKGNGSSFDRITIDLGPNADAIDVAIGALMPNGAPDISVLIDAGGAYRIDVLENDGDASFTLAATIPLSLPGGAPPVSISAAPVVSGYPSPDGGDDLIVAFEQASAFVVVINDGAGVFTPSAPLPLPRRPRRINPIDFTRDGIVSLAVLSATDSAVVIVPGAPGLNFLPPAADIPVGDGPIDMVVVDLLGNGRPDIVTANADGGTLSVIVHDGGLQFRPSASIDLLIDGVRLPPISLAAIDFAASAPGVDRIDLVVLTVDENDAVTLLGIRNDSISPEQAVFGPPAPIDLGPDAAPFLVRTADLDGDGETDLVLLDSGAPGFAGPAGGILTIRSPAGAHPADLNGDGIVGFADMLILLAAWGPCPRICPADLTGDGVVGFDDLLVLLAAWSA